MRHSLIAGCFFLALNTAHAQTPAAGGQTQIGQVVATWGGGFSSVGEQTRFYGGVTLTSKTFGLAAQTVSFAYARSKAAGASGLQKATAVGAPGKPVVAHFTQTELARAYTVTADKAVYTPAPAKSASTGTLDFTGHVVLSLRDPAALDGPAVSKSEHIVVRLGSGPAYPQIDGAAGTLSFTPLQ